MGGVIMKLAEYRFIFRFIFLWFLLPFCLMGCVDDANKTTVLVYGDFAGDRVVAKDYHVLAANHEERQCRHQPARNAEVLVLLKRGQKISLLSVTEKGQRVNGDLWLHVYAGRGRKGTCFVLAAVLAPVASSPVIK